MYICLLYSSAPLCPTLHDPIDCSPPGSSVHGILQGRILKWVAISSTRGSSQPRDQTHISCVSCITGRFFTWWAIREALYIFILPVEPDSYQPRSISWARVTLKTHDPDTCRPSGQLRASSPSDCVGADLYKWVLGTQPRSGHTSVSEEEKRPSVVRCLPPSWGKEYLFQQEYLLPNLFW